jgi:hypothetical protein
VQESRELVPSLVLCFARHVLHSLTDHSLTDHSLTETEPLHGADEEETFVVPVVEMIAWGRVVAVKPLLSPVAWGGHFCSGVESKGIAEDLTAAAQRYQSEGALQSVCGALLLMLFRFWACIW